MATQGYGVDITLIAAVDFTTKQFHAVKVDAAGKAALAGAGDFAVGILQDNVPAGEAARVRISGKSKMVADAAVAAGAKVTPSADAQGATATVTTDNILGVAASAAAAAGEVFEVIITHSGTGVAD
jgi:hypothetical protein